MIVVRDADIALIIMKACKDKCDLNKGSHLSHPKALLPKEGVTYVQGSL